uniref:(northern house mosquito) hypothetical protein n=1 Tax=Culex pipiens TaxID=7175 RepID=A0A8D8J0R0_CULPI
MTVRLWLAVMPERRGGAPHSPPQLRQEPNAVSGWRNFRPSIIFVQLLVADEGGLDAVDGNPSFLAIYQDIHELLVSFDNLEGSFVRVLERSFHCVDPYKHTFAASQVFRDENGSFSVMRVLDRADLLHGTTQLLRKL